MVPEDELMQDFDAEAEDEIKHILTQMCEEIFHMMQMIGETQRLFAANHNILAKTLEGPIVQVTEKDDVTRPTMVAGFINTNLIFIRTQMLEILGRCDFPEVMALEAIVETHNRQHREGSNTPEMCAFTYAMLDAAAVDFGAADFSQLALELKINQFCVQEHIVDNIVTSIIKGEVEQ